MLRKFILLPLLCASIISFAQVGINTSDPKATLDVNLPSSYTAGQQAGVSFPHLSGDQIEQMSTTTLRAGSLVYATDISTASTKNIDSIGYWYWTGDSVKKWQPLFLHHKSVVSYFYAPSISLPVTDAGLSTDANDDISFNTATNTYSIKLFSIYQKQYAMSGDIPGSTRSAIKNSTATTLPILSNTNLDYFVTYFDNTVFDPQSISLSNDGVLSYQIIENSMTTEKTFMNIIFRVK